MKATPAKIQLQQLTLLLNKKGHQENCVQTQAVLDETKLKAQLFQKRPTPFPQKPPLVSQHRSRHHAVIIVVHNLITKDHNTNPIDIQPHNNNTVQTKKCG
jgi:hypothetical protein